MTMNETFKSLQNTFSDRQVQISRLGSHEWHFMTSRMPTFDSEQPRQDQIGQSMNCGQWRPTISRTSTLDSEKIVQIQIGLLPNQVQKVLDTLGVQLGFNPENSVQNQKGLLIARIRVLIKTNQTQTSLLPKSTRVLTQKLTEIGFNSGSSGHGILFHLYLTSLTESCLNTLANGGQSTRKLSKKTYNSSSNLRKLTFSEREGNFLSENNVFCPLFCHKISLSRPHPHPLELRNFVWGWFSFSLNNLEVN